MTIPVSLVEAKDCMDLIVPELSERLMTSFQDEITRMMTEEGKDLKSIQQFNIITTALANTLANTFMLMSREPMESSKGFGFILNSITEIRIKEAIEHSH